VLGPINLTCWLVSSPIGLPLPSRKLTWARIWMPSSSMFRTGTAILSWLVPGMRSTPARPTRITS